MEEQITITYGVKQKCEWPSQARDNEKAQITTTLRGTVQVVYSNEFWRKTHYWAYGNWKS